jgi:hypothetical protein
VSKPRQTPKDAKFSQMALFGLRGFASSAGIGGASERLKRERQLGLLVFVKTLRERRRSRVALPLKVTG